MNILVTGGAGYIGSHVVRALLRDGHCVVVYDNLSTGHSSLVLGNNLVVADVRDRHTLASHLKGVDAVMHLAAHAYVGESVYKPRTYFDNNVVGGLTLLEAALDCGIKQIVFSSTCAVFGVPARLPIAEDAPRQPINPYGVSKLFLEHALEAFGRANQLQFVVLRYFNAAGADESGEIGEAHDPEPHLIPRVLDSLCDGQEVDVYGTDYPTPDGTCVRDYVHVSDIAEAHLLALQYLRADGESTAVNLGTGRGYSVKEIIQEVERVTCRSVLTRSCPRRAGDPPSLFADSTRAGQLLGWKPKRSLSDIVETAWKWSQNRRAVLGAPWRTSHLRVGASD